MKQRTTGKAQFLEIFTSTDRIFISGGGLGTIQLCYEILRFSRYFLSLKSCQLVKQIINTSLLLIITFSFTCDERKIGSTIEKSQNIMHMIVVFSTNILRKLKNFFKVPVFSLYIFKNNFPNKRSLSDLFQMYSQYSLFCLRNLAN